MTHLTDWQRGYQAGVLQGRTRAAIIEGREAQPLWSYDEPEEA